MGDLEEARASCLLPGPMLAIAVIWGMKQQIKMWKEVVSIHGGGEGWPLCVCICSYNFQINKQFFFQILAMAFINHTVQVTLSFISLI